MQMKYMILGLIGFWPMALGFGKGGSAMEMFPRMEGVRTTAYSKGPAHNGKWGSKNALGKPLQTGTIKSAAADWSRWPVGTKFRVVETGQLYEVDDYGSALVGTGTIDLFHPTENGVRKWGVRRVTVEIIRWGDPDKSLKILKTRGKYRHIREMVQSLSEQESV